MESIRCARLPVTRRESSFFREVSADCFEVDALAQFSFVVGDSVAEAPREDGVLPFVLGVLDVLCSRREVTRVHRPAGGAEPLPSNGID